MVCGGGGGGVICFVYYSKKGNIYKIISPCHSYLMSSSINQSKTDEKGITTSTPLKEVSGVEEFSFDTSMKKKKKKPSTQPIDIVSTERSSSPAQTITSTTSTNNTEYSEDQNTISFSSNAPIDDHGIDISNDNDGAAWLNSNRDYTYSELLGRVFGILRQNNPDLAGDRRKFTIIPPLIAKEGSKKTAFCNITELCRRIRRPVEHVTQFLLCELGTTGNADGSGRLIIKGKFQQLQFENLLRRYIGEYVSCKTCRSPETQLTRENRLFFLKCDSCGATRSVAVIKAGFRAQTHRPR